MPDGAIQPSTETVFIRAWNDYLDNVLPAKKGKRDFIADACSSDNITPESINEAMLAAEAKDSERGSRKIAVYLKPVVSVMRSYSHILETLVSADPTPCALIWGGLKVILDGLHRYQNLFETIQKALETLSGQILQINQWQALYVGDERMQRLFYDTYIHMIRFWSRVNKECARCSFASRIRRATATFSTSKLDAILVDLRESIKDIADQARIVEASLSKEERKAAAKERAANDSFRKQIEQEVRERLEAQQKEQARAEYDRVLQWLRAVDSQMEADFRRHKDIRDHRLPGTCQWLIQDQRFIDWRDGISKPSILWVHAPPGSGKSFLCSAVMESLQSSDIPLAFHFFDFQQVYSADDTLRLLGDQLLRHYWAKNNCIAPELLAMTQQTHPFCHESICEVITFLVQNLSSAVFMLDGLDEGLADTKSGVRAMLEFIIPLAERFPDTVRVWCSSQYRPYFNEVLGKFSTIEISSFVEIDVMRYLRATVERLDLDPEDQQAFLTKLSSQAGPNFLWASLMMDDLQERATSTSAMQEMVFEGKLPANLDDYYRAIFRRIPKHHRAIACKIFGMLTFAKRPLRLEELSEAVGLLEAKDPLTLTARDLPREKILSSLFAPLIEVKELKTSEYTDRICHIFHSTVKDFILNFPDVLALPDDPRTDLRISPCIPAKACMMFLGQNRYRDLLVPNQTTGAWLDVDGESVDGVGHRFMFYSAKYWDKHLDDLKDYPDTCKGLHDRVVSFITSPNFRTCIQVQSLWVDSQFTVFLRTWTDPRKYLRRVFPSWFVQESPGIDLWTDYRRFLHEWKYFLSCQECSKRTDHSCRVLPCIGDLSRCWWSALGSTNFLSKFQGRYRNFSLQSDAGSAMQAFEGISAKGDEVWLLYLMQPPASESEPLELLGECWTFGDSGMPVVRSSQTIHVKQSDSGWSTYANAMDDKTLAVGLAPFAGFDPDCSTLRIGTQIFARNDQDCFQLIPGAAAPRSERHLPYVEEFARRGSIVVLTSRSRLIRRPAKGVKASEVFEGKPDKKSKEKIDDWDADASDSGSDSQPEDDYESWSESSSIFSDWDSDDESENSSFIIDSDDDESESCSDDEQSEAGELPEEAEEAEKPAEDADDNLPDDANSDESDVEVEAIVGDGQVVDEDEEFDWDAACNDDAEQTVFSHTWRRKFRKSDIHETWATVTILDTSTATPKTLFGFTRPLPFKIYGSPPVIHPTAPLAVWPVGCGDILFVDFERESHFVRRLRTSTYLTRQILMKCHFSTCGRFLHIVSIEGRYSYIYVAKGSRAPIRMAVVVLTYRLSERKPSRSPPQLIHQVRFPVGLISSLQGSKPPFTFTFHAREVYINCSDIVLRVFRVPLFGEHGTAVSTGSPAKITASSEVVSMPKKSIFLPETAKNGVVHYFPIQKDGEPGQSGRIIVSRGNQARTASEFGFLDFLDAVAFEGQGAHFNHKEELQPPMGCYVREQDDFGGWGRSVEKEYVVSYRDSGCLSRHLEKFDPSDDCDLEPYIY